MKNPNPLLALALPLVVITVLPGCDSGSSTPHTTEASLSSQEAPDEPQGFTVPEGMVSIRQIGDVSFGDGEVTWEVTTSSPVTVDWKIIGSGGGHSGSHDLIPVEAVGSALDSEQRLILRWSQVEVRGADLLEDLRVLADKSAVATLTDSVPGIADSRLTRYAMTVQKPGDTAGQVDLPEGDADAFLTAVQEHAASEPTSHTSRGYVAGSVHKGAPSERGMTYSSRTTGSADGAPKLHGIGEPIWLLNRVEYPSGSGYSGWDTTGDEFVITRRDDAGETVRIPLAEFEHPAWGLVVNFHPAD